jgi:hypothetical protein
MDASAREGQTRFHFVRQRNPLRVKRTRRVFVLGDVGRDERSRGEGVIDQVADGIKRDGWGALRMRFLYECGVRHRSNWF